MTMKLDTLIRSFLIAGLISLIALLLESAYYGLQNEVYSITTPFFSSVINSPLNMAVLGIIFVSTFVIVLNSLGKKERA
ncbi:hypothetical protein MM_3232 [Methanosarcina mazei Go1]|jgi:hypothetical protein|uniref:Uncharacterized protein n=5 Tax=Methanosarcina mazei TaxID=2209 RepID=Q8PS52_METMA|nr:hypothetical protein MM_3232 [Methanosarcina mazei Go1]